MLTEKLSRLIGQPAQVTQLPLTLAYPPKALGWETLKGAVGAAICFGVVGFLSPTPFLGWPIGGLGLLFGAYGMQQFRRRALRYRLDDQGFTELRGDARRAIRWQELAEFHLKFYPQNKRDAVGTLVLILKDGSRGRLKMDSTLEQFPTLLDQAATAARACNLTLDPTTEANLAQLDL